MRKIALIIAMHEEFEPLQDIFTVKEKTQLHSFSVIHSHYKSLDMTFIISGIGKVNAAVATTLAHTHFKPDVILNIGSSAGTKEHLKHGDIVIASKLTYHDVDVTAFKYTLGQIPQMPEFYTPCEKILSFLESTPDATFGLIVAGDNFIDHEDKLHRIKTNFPDVHAIDMESTAIAQTCYHLKQPFLVIRSITDAGDENAANSHAENLEISQKKAGNFLMNLLDTINGKTSYANSTIAEC